MSPNPQDQQGDLLKHVYELLNSRTAEERRSIVEHHSELLTDAADNLLAEMAATRTSEDSQRAPVACRALLRRCREIGVSAAFAETGSELNSDSISDRLRVALDELRHPSSTTELPHRIELCRRALELVEREQNPGLWAALQGELANALAQNPHGDREENLERAIAGYDQALVVMTREVMPGDWAKATNNLADAYGDRIRGDRAENLERAIQMYGQALEVRTREAMPVEWATTQANLALAYSHRIRGDRSENQEHAITGYEQALEVLTREAMPVEWAATQMNLASAFLQRSRGDRAENLERAIQLYQQALEVRTREAMPGEWAMTMHNLAAAYSARIRGDRAENLEKAIQLYKQVLEVRTRKAMPVEWAGTTQNLANAYIDRIRGDRAENLEGAIQLYRQALEVRTRKAVPVEWAMTMHNLADAYSDRIRGDRAENLEEAIQLYQQELEVMTREAMPVEWAQTMQNLAAAYNDRIRGDRAENLERAIVAFEHALEVRTREAMPVEWAQTMQNLALAYNDRIRGDRAENRERAIVAFEHALEVRTREAMPVEWAQTMQNLALAYRERVRGDRAKNLERAIAGYRQALEVRTREAMPVEWALTMQNLALAYRHRICGDRAENLERAIAGYQQALEVRTREAIPVKWAQTMQNLADAYSERVRGDRAENLERAIATYEQVLGVMTREAMPVDHLRVQRALGNILFGEQRYKAASTAYEGAFTASEDLYRLGATPEARQAELREVRDVPAKLAYALTQEGELGKALVVLERGRARGLAEALALEEVPLDQLLPEERATFEETRARIRLLQTEARLPEETPAKRSFIALSEELHAAYADLDKVIALIRKRLPEFLPETTLSDIQAAASWAPLVYVLATEAGGLALLVPDPSAAIVPVWLPGFTEERLRERVVGYFDAHFTWRVAPGDDESKREAWFHALDDTTQWLRQVAMGPIIEALDGVPKAVLIPTGLLSLLPLHAAWKEDPTRPTGRHYALDSLAFSYAPSAKSLLAAQEVASSSVPEILLAIEEPRPVEGSPLPGSEDEVMTAISSFADHQVLRHQQATREAVRAGLPKYSVLHFACHGSAEFQQPLNSGLAMANYQNLTLRDFLDLHLPGARLAVLSACETGLPGTQLPDEVLSLPAGLLQAGFAGVAASLWSVSDISTAILMARFYELWRKGGRGPVEALREAQQWVTSTAAQMKLADWYERQYEASRRSDPDAFAWMTYYQTNPHVKPFEHPYFWAGFFFTGV
jgi:CHAT domain-containing protein